MDGEQRVSAGFIGLRPPLNPKERHLAIKNTPLSLHLPPISPRIPRPLLLARGLNMALLALLHGLPGAHGPAGS